MKNLNLGLIYNEDGNLINHRSLLKIILNPFLRFFGLQIITPYDKNTNSIIGIINIEVCKRTKKMLFKNSWQYNIQHKVVVKKRRFI